MNLLKEQSEFILVGKRKWAKRIFFRFIKARYRRRINRVVDVYKRQVHDTIERLLATLKEEGKKPYFIAGGGHGNLGTQAYVDCYKAVSYTHLP